ncbi:hypothetical protein Tco_1075469 [Tanacetum coccineum]
MKEQAYNVDRDKDHKSSTTKAISLISRREFLPVVIMNSLSGEIEYSEEEEAEEMEETMEQYMSKTRTDYGLGVAWPKIEKKDSFELKGQFL